MLFFEVLMIPNMLVVAGIASMLVWSFLASEAAQLARAKVPVKRR